MDTAQIERAGLDERPGMEQPFVLKSISRERIVLYNEQLPWQAPSVERVSIPCRGPAHYHNTRTTADICPVPVSDVERVLTENPLHDEYGRPG